MRVHLFVFFWGVSLWLSSDPQTSSEQLSLIIMATANFYLVLVVCQALRSSQTLPHMSPDCHWAGAGQRANHTFPSFLILPTPLCPPEQERRKPPTVEWSLPELKPVLLPLLGGEENSPYFCLIPLEFPPLLPVFPKVMSSFAKLGQVVA